MVNFAYLIWDPNPEVFRIPFIDLPILWYGLFFAVGFMLGFPIFVRIVERFFLQRPDFEERELIGEIDASWLKEDQLKGKSALIRALNQWLVNPKPMIERMLSKNQVKQASCSLHSQEALRRLQLEQMFPTAIFSLRKQSVQIADRLTIYIIIATVLGARVGHYLFYEKPSDYMYNLWELVNLWRMRGLSSHGAAIGIWCGVAFFAYRYRHKLRGISRLHLLDFISAPTALAGAFIRLGNFFNQEILGTVTNVRWGVIFAHPADGTYPTPRHPVQLYEAIIYLLVFFMLWRLTFFSKYLLEKGQLFGWFLVLVFGFRFFIEYWKEEQSRLMPSSFDLTMGQILSIPTVVIGIFLLLRNILHRSHLAT